MLEKIRTKILAFIESDRDVPLLAGFSVGFYMLLFYYYKNFTIANSFEQLIFFLAYYICVPMLVFFTIYKLMGAIKLNRYRKNFLFTGIITFFAFYLLQGNGGGFPKGYLLPLIFAVAVLLSIWIKKYYKAVLLIILVMSVFNMKPIASAAWKYVNASDEWKKLPDDIEKVVFKTKANIYYIQPDGYTSFSNLKNNSNYKFDNSGYETFLKQRGFTLYDTYRSNYMSTLLSNSATFSMKHHYIQKDVDFYGARKIIVGDNPVLRIFKNNGYKTSFITQSPYLIINRPNLAYDFCNFNYNEIPYLGDGLSLKRDVLSDIKEQMAVNGPSGNFYFVENFLPGHIPTFEAYSKGNEVECANHTKDLARAESWLKKTIAYITDKDPGAIIIVGADHGGFAGFSYVHQTLKKITDEELINSVFGAQLAIRWNGNDAKDYDKGLKSGINLFRTLFSCLAQEKKYLNGLQENGSYIYTKEPHGVYRYINNEDKIVFEKL